MRWPRLCIPLKRLWVVAAAGIAALFTPTTAYAHGKIEGIGDFYNGVAHPLRVPEHALLLVALSLVLARHEPLRLTPPMAVFAVCSALAIVLAGSAAPAGVGPVVLLVLLMGLGGLVVWGAALPVAIRAVLCGVVAVAVGLDSAAEGDSLPASIKLGLGTWLCMAVLVVDLAFYASLSKAKWMDIGRRVLGAWVLAIAILMLAFHLKPGG